MRSLVSSAVFAALAAVAVDASAQMESRAPTDVAAQPLAMALEELSRERGIQIVYRSEMVEGLRSPGATGALTVAEAMERVLAGTHLSYAQMEQGVITLTARQMVQERPGPSLTSIAATSTVTAPVVQSDRAVAAGVPLEAPQIHEVVVTGSRLLRDSTVAPIPVTAIDSSELTASGAVNVGELIAELPSFGIGSSRTSNVGSDSPQGLGATLLNLRSLGTNRTLVVVDGRRHVGSVAGSTAVDVGSIPVALIERVEVSTGGASVSYGADAVSGVVNLVLKDDFEGLQFSGQYGGAEEGDAESIFLSATGGGNFADGRGNAVVNLTYTSDGLVDGRDRSWLARQTEFVRNPANSGGADGVPAEILIDGARMAQTSRNGFLYGAVTGEIVNFNDDGSVRRFDPGTHPGGTFVLGGDNYNALDLFRITNPVQNTTVLGKVSYDLTASTKAFFEGKYHGTKASNRNQPSLDIFTHFEDGDLFFVDPNNPFMPQGDPLFDDLVSNNLGMLILSRVHDDLGFREATSRRDLFRLLGGVSGTLPISDWSWEVFGQWGRTEESRSIDNVRNGRRFRLAADAVTDVAGVTGVSPGSPACRATLDATLGGGAIHDRDVRNCVPLNIFGYGLASQDAIDYVNATVMSSQLTSQVVAAATLSGTLLQLPAGAVSFATGIEYREEESEFRPDTALQLGETFLGTILPVVGDYDVAEAFLETRLPLLRNVPGAQLLAIEGGVRFSEYSSVGDTLTWRLGMEWAPVSDVRLRVSRATAVRAPNIGELYQPRQTTFGAGSFADPCDRDNVNLGPDPARRLANCTAALASLGLNPATFDDPLPIAKTTVVGGNPDLGEETADSLTLGAVFTPRALPGFSFSVDYFDIEIEDAVTSPNAATIVNDCYDRFDSVDNAYCALFDRSTDSSNYGTIRNIVATQLNIGALQVTGVDFEANYGFELGNLAPGRMKLRLVGTYLDKYDTLLANDRSTLDESAGELGFPEWRFNLQASYHLGGFSASWLTRFIDSGVRDVQVANPIEQSDPFQASATTISDLQLRYDTLLGAQRYGFHLGVNNVFDADPPAITRQRVVPRTRALYDTIGRFIYAGVTVSL